MTPLTPRQLPDHLLSQGFSTFSIDDARDWLGGSDDAVRRALARLREAGQVFSPVRGFWVVIPPEYRSWRVVPAAHFIDEMMRWMDRAYYVALLSAAERHGAGHQAPQVFQVMCRPALRDREVERVRLRFYTGAHVPSAPSEPHNVPTGTMRVATPELTVVDLVDMPGEGGGLSNVATILSELGTLHGQSLAAVAGARDRSVVRRVGWMVSHFGRCDDLRPLERAANAAEGHPVPLRAGGGRRGRVDGDWGVRVNTSVEPDG